MNKTLKYLIAIIVALVLQVTLLPAYLDDPFKPNLLLIIVVFMGFRGEMPGGSLSSLLLGLIQDCFSGIYLGLNGFSYLFIFILINKTAHRFYTDNSILMVLGAFLATQLHGLLNLLLLVMFSAADGIYLPLLSGILPQGLVNALMASLFFAFAPLARLEESR
jgi:rod shape-determining protein MreD